MALRLGLLLGWVMVLWSPLPVSATDTIYFNVTEENDIGTFVGDIKQTVFYRSRFTGINPSSDVVFTLWQPDGTNANLFQLDPQHGVLKTSAVIDREAIRECRNNERCSVDLGGVVRINQETALFKIQVGITDKNDNSPTFMGPNEPLIMSESTPLGSRWHVQAAVDPDSPKFSIVDYRLDSNTDKFKLLEQRNDIGSFDLKLELVEHLDAEEEDSYRLDITAIDGGRPRRRGSISIRVLVNDSNDNNPQFEQPVYEVSIPENALPNHDVVMVTATDADRGENARIEYSFVPSTRTAYGDLFWINPESGLIKLGGSLDHEENANIRLSVEARDHGANSVPARTLVLITVEDVNDNAPEIFVDNGEDPSASHTVYLDEHSVVGSLVAIITVRDPDSGDNGRTSCRLRNNVFILKNLSDVDYKVVSVRVIDREESHSSRFTMHVVCTDNGSPRRQSSLNLTVITDDINDHAPQFSKPHYNMSICENRNLHTELGHVLATDRDIGDNGRIHYEILGDMNTTFSINESTGVIYSNKVFDRENIDRYEFEVVASDHGQDQNVSRTRVSVTILDEDDETPTFVGGPFEFSVGENLPPRTQVGHMTATDLDLPPFNNFIFRLDDDLHAESAFTIDAETGDIFTRQQLDRETKDCYSLTVVVCSAPCDLTRSKYSAALVTIKVTDVNDNFPVVFFPSERNFTVTISSIVRLNAVVVRVSATDADEGENGRLSYNLVPPASGEVQDLFIIRPNNGEIIVNRELQGLGGTSYHLQVKVQDHGAEQRKAAVRDLKVVVMDLAVQQTGSPPVSLTATHLAIIVGAILGFLLIIFILIFTIMIIRRRNKMAAIHNSKKEKPASPSELYWARSDLVTGVGAMDDASPTDSERSGNIIDPSTIILKGEDAVAAKLAELAEMRAVKEGTYRKPKLAMMHPPPSRDNQSPRRNPEMENSIERRRADAYNGNDQQIPADDRDPNVTTVAVNCYQPGSTQHGHPIKSSGKLGSFSNWLSPEQQSLEGNAYLVCEDGRKTVRFDNMNPRNTTSLKKGSHVVISNGNGFPHSSSDVCIVTDSHYPPYSANVGSLV